MYIFILLSAGDYVVVDVGTSMEGNFLGGTKSPKKVHFECGNVRVESGLLQAINLAPVGSICTTAYKQEKSPSITFIP